MAKSFRGKTRELIDNNNSRGGSLADFSSDVSVTERKTSPETARGADNSESKAGSHSNVADLPESRNSELREVVSSPKMNKTAKHRYEVRINDVLDDSLRKYLYENRAKVAPTLTVALEEFLKKRSYLG